MRTAILMPMLMTLLMIAPSRADEPIRDLMDASTVLVARLDLDRLDVAALQTWADAQLARHEGKLDAKKVESLRRDLAPLLERAASHRAMLREMRVRRVYVVGYLAFMDLPVRLVLVHDGDAEAVKRYVASLGLEPTAGPGRVIGTPKNLAALLGSGVAPGQSPALLPLLQKSNAPLVVAVGLGDETRGIFEESNATLPKDLGEVPVTVLTYGIQTAVLEAWLPPQPRMNATIASRDAGSAAALREWMRGRLEALREQEKVDLTSLLPGQREASLVRSLEADELETLAATLLPALLGAREQATNARVMSQQRLLMQAVVLYGVDHKGEWPESLDQAVRATQIDRTALVNPRRPDLGEKGFVYVRPGKPMNDLQDPASRLVIYESHETFPAGGIGVAFADGHAEWITTPEAFAELKRAAD